MSILPQTHRILLVESHTHFNHIFTFVCDTQEHNHFVLLLTTDQPRFAILSGHEHKAFVPYTGFFPSHSHHKVITARAVQVYSDHIQLSKSFENSINVSYDYLILATGTRLAAPSMMPYDDAASSIPYLQRYQDQLRRSEKIVIVGGGAVGVQMALDLKELYPQGKEVVVVHSRDRLMQVFHPKLHKIISGAFEEKGIRLITKTRAKVPAGGFPNDGSCMAIEILNGEQVEGDFVILATGQKPNNQLVAQLPASNDGLINSTNGFLRIRPSLQLQDEAYSNVFAVGDIADTGLHKAARPGAAQAKVVAQNVLSLIEGQKPEAKFEKSPRGIHLSLGLVRICVHF